MYNKIKYNELIEAIDKFHIQKKTSKENYSSIEIRDFDLFGFAFEDVDLSFVSFVNCNLKKTVFKNVYMCNTHFVNSDISGASFDKPAYKIHMKPILSDCIIDEETFIPEEYDYCEKTGYIIIDNCLLHVIASRNNAIDIDEEKQQFFVPTLRILSCEPLTKTPISYQENEIIDAFDYEEELLFTVYFDKENALQNHNNKVSDADDYLLYKIPCLSSKPFVSVEEFSRIILDFYKKSPYPEIVATYSGHYYDNGNPKYKATLVLTRRDITHSEICKHFYRLLSK